MSEALRSDSEAKSKAEIASEAEEDPRVVWLDDEDADDLVTTLSSDNARTILRELHSEPATISELSDRVDSSLQNTRHHVNNLHEAGLIDVSDTEYSSKGREMNVYAPADEPFVVCVGKQDNKNQFLDALKKFVTGIGVIAALSVLAQFLFGSILSGTASGPGGGPTGVPDQFTGGGSGISGILLSVPAGVVFFAGGFIAISMVAAYWYWENER